MNSTCKCVKSKCLMLYCECYRRGVTCNDDCVCIDCQNTKEHAGGGGGGNEGASEVVAAVMDAKKRESTPAVAAPSPSKPKARRPYKEGRRDRDLDVLKIRQGNGCACVNSNCLKKYCVCFHAEVECAVGRCKCVNCKNPNGSISSVNNTYKAKTAKLCTFINDEQQDVVRTAENTKCKCTRTHCLKLYCDCFRQDLMCNETCNCLDCKNTEEESGPEGARAKAKKEIIKLRGAQIFQTPKKKSGVGCSCTKNKCATKYCDCNARGVGCNPAVCNCINCANMMKPHSEMLDHELEPEVEEDETQVFIPSDVDATVSSKIKGLSNYAHLIDDFEERRITNPSEKMKYTYISRENAAETAKKVMEEESKLREEIKEEIAQLEAALQAKVRRENDALDNYRKKTNKVMCLEMEEPCRWNTMYNRLKDYVMKANDLPPVPSACTSEGDRKLSIWVQEMKSLVYSKSERITNAPHRIEALEALGVEWIETSEERWNRMFKRLEAWKRQHKTVQLPSFMQCRKSKDRSLIALRHWVDIQEQQVQSGDLTMEKLKKLQALGLPLQLSREQEWQYYMVELLKFRSKYGHLRVSGEAHADLVSFVNKVCNMLKKGSDEKLTTDEMDDLRIKGLLFDLQDLNKNPVGRPSASGVTKVAGMKLVPLERVKEVNYWAGMLQQLKAYHAQNGTFDLPQPNKLGGGAFAQLRDWVETQRHAYENRTLEDTRIKELEKIGFEFAPWDNMFNKLQQFKKEAGTARLPKVYKGEEEDEEQAELCKWLMENVKLYRKDELDANKKKKLRKIGVYLTKGHMGKVSWEDRFEEMMEYYHTHKTCLPKRNGPLRQWVIELVDLIQNGYVSNKRQQMIDAEFIGPYLKPEVIFKDGGTSASKNKRKATATGDSIPNDNKKLKGGNDDEAAAAV